MGYKKGAEPHPGNKRNEKKGDRGIKRRVQEILELADFDARQSRFDEIPKKKIVNALFSFLQSTDEYIKWAAVSAMGPVVANIAEKDMEAGRGIVRRLMWNLNDESGGIGWGAPEAIGEILACHEDLAKEYTHILLSYAREDGNYLEHEMLQRGLLWGLGRLGRVRPHLVKEGAHYLIPYLESKDAHVRGLSAWVMGLLGIEAARSNLEKLVNDSSYIQIYLDHRVTKIKVKDLVSKALRMP